MELFSFTTIAGPTEGQYREKGSKFLAFAYPVKSATDIRDRIEELKKTYFDARHHCFAWMLGPERKVFRAFDDGEPSHSAGDPILGQIRAKGLTNVLIVVVRYFGGVKLGVGGLIFAYKAAAEDALSKSTIVEVEIRFSLCLEFGYEATPAMMKLVKEFDLSIIRQHFSDICRLELEARLREKQRLVEKLELMKATGTRFSVML
jgi:uncharacterized YigZ family protein